MLALELLAWWYGPGWAKLARNIGSEIRIITQLFSVPILARTMVAPWKRLVSTGSQSLQARMRGVLDNTVSRLVGFMVRSMVLVTACLLVILVALGGTVALLLWPLVPVGGIVLIVKGVL